MDAKAARIEELGMVLFGEASWKSRLADAVGLTRQHVGAMMSGDRRVTREVEEKVVELIKRELPRRDAGTEVMRNHLASIEREHLEQMRKAGHQPRAAVHDEVNEVNRVALGSYGHWTEIGDEIGIPRDRLTSLYLGKEPWTRELSDQWRAWMVETMSATVGRAVSLNEARGGFGLSLAPPERPAD